MALILNIETTTHVCSVALSRDGQMVRIRENHEGKSHAALLTYYIDEILKQEGLGVKDLDAVGISQGPGSYTGLRIGVSTAKGLCYGASKPLVAVSTLQALTRGLLHAVKALEQPPPLDDKTILVPMLDARRMEVYSALLNRKLEFIREGQAEVIGEQTYASWLEGCNMVFFGTGSDKCRQVIAHPHAYFVEGIEPSAQHMSGLAEEKYQQGIFEDVAYFEPYYLKDFIATKPRKNILRRRKSNQ